MGAGKGAADNPVAIGEGMDYNAEVGQHISSVSLPIKDRAHGS